MLEEEVHRLGFGYITKPFEPSRLVQIIHDLIRGKERRNGTERAPRILIPDPERNTDPGRVIGQAFTDPEIPN
jgi:DNA-binding response OmpR family regulator